MSTFYHLKTMLQNKPVRRWFAVCVVFFSISLSSQVSWAQGPTVTETDPVHLAIDAPRDTNIRVTFDAPIEPASVGPQTFALHAAQQGFITGTYVISPNNRSVTLTPTHTFFAGEIIRPVVQPQGGQIGSLQPDNRYQWQFTATQVRNRCQKGFTSVPLIFPGVYDSSLSWADYDRDGDLDFMAMGDAGLARVAQLGRNDNGSFSVVPTGFSGLASGVATWGDYDNDGDLDLLQTGQDNTYNPSTTLWRNDDTAFNAVTTNFPQLESSAAAWGDYNNDGDLDLLLVGVNGSTISTDLWENQAGIFTVTAQNLTGVQNGDVAWGDYDNDGDLDILLAGITGNGNSVTEIWRNDDGTFNQAQSLTGVSGGQVQWIDTDGDRDLDVILTGLFNLVQPTTELWRNDDGTFNKQTVPFNPLTDSSATWGDFDNDGDPDLLLSGQTGNGSRRTELWRNDAGNFSAVTHPFSNVSRSDATWGDYDNDGDLDLLLSGFDGTDEYLELWRNDDCSYPPTVIDVSPSRHLTAAPLTSSVVLTYSPPLSAGSVTSQTITLQGMMQGMVDATQQVSGAQVTITPRQPLFAGEAVHVVATTRTVNLTGTAAITPAAWQFTAGATSNRCVAGFQAGPALTGLFLSAAAWADVDNDHDVDIVLSGKTDSGTLLTQLWRNQNGIFTDSGLSLPGLQSASLDWGDFDNDGDPDLLMTGDDGQQAITQLWRNDDGNLVNHNAALTPVKYGDAAWGDYDNDGDLDLLLGGFNGTLSVTQIWRNEGGNFTLLPLTLPELDSGSVAWGDYDNDGDLDLLLAGASDPVPLTQIWANDAGNFTAIGAGLPGLSDGEAVWLDYDNDTRLDVLLTGKNAAGTPLTDLWRNTGAGFSQQTTPFPNLIDSSAAAGDYDNDGDLDILLTGSDGINTQTTLWRNAQGSFSPGPTLPQNLGGDVVAWADYDNDADLDFLLTGWADELRSDIWRNDDCPQPPLVQALNPAHQAIGTAPTATLRITYHTPLSPSSVTSQTVAIHGAFSGLITGSVQVISRYITFTPTHSFFPNERIHATVATNTTALTGTTALTPTGWQFTAGSIAGRCVRQFSAISPTLTGLYLSSNAWADYDRDGDLDVLLTGTDGQQPHTHLWRNDGNGRFSQQAITLPGVDSGSVAWGDYDNDADPDILLSGKTVGGQWLTQIWRNDNGNFNAAVTDTLPTIRYGSVAWGDYDNDADPDILLSGFTGSDTVSQIWRNDDGVFTQTATLPPVDDSSVAWGDYDNDGDLDVLLAGAGEVLTITQIWRNDGGNFTAAVTETLTGITSGDVAWGDYNNDGDLDVLLGGVTASGDPTLQLWDNQQGVFSPVFTNAITPLVGVRLDWGDYDNDGDLDILLGGNRGAVSVSEVWQNTGGQFSLRSTPFNNQGGDNVLWADYNNDGGLDVLTTGWDTDGNLVSQLWRNQACFTNFVYLPLVLKD